MSDGPADPATRGRVVVGVDGSEHSLRALDRAADEAGRRGGELEIVCGGLWPRRAVVPVTPADAERLLELADEVVDEAAQRARKRVQGLRTVPSTQIDLPAADALVRAGRSAALTVVGTRGHGGFTGLLLGSVSLRVAAHCEGPLMIVRGDGGAAEGHVRGSTLVGLASASDREAVRFGFEEAARSGSALRVVHAWAYPRTHPALQLPPHELKQARDGALRLVREMVGPLRAEHPQVRVAEEEQGGSAAAVLIEASRAADVLVLTTHRRQRRLGLQLGPIAHAVLHHAHCPVVLVPAD